MWIHTAILFLFHFAFLWDFFPNGCRRCSYSTHRKQNIFVCVYVYVCLCLNEWSVLWTHLLRLLFIPHSSMHFHSNFSHSINDSKLPNFFPSPLEYCRFGVGEVERMVQVTKQIARYLWCVHASIVCFLREWWVKLKFALLLQKCLFDRD